MSTPTISVGELSSMLQAGTPLTFIDVRTPGEYERLHLAAAQLVPLVGLDPAHIATLRKSPDEPIFAICASGARSAMACKKLDAAGVSPAISVEGGIAAWEAAGLPVERAGPEVMSIERQVRIGAGLVVLTGLILGKKVHPRFRFLAAFAGTGLLLSGLTDYCGLALLLAKAPWNRKGK